MKKTRRFYSATLAAIMSCCIGVSANAAEEKLELISIPAPNGATIGGDGLVLRGDNGFEKFVIIDVDKWQTTGEFVYDDISLDIDVSKLKNVSNFNGQDGYFIMKFNDSNTSYIMKYDEATMSAKLVKSTDEWCCAVNDGYYFTCSDGNMSITSPDNTNLSVVLQGHCLSTGRLNDNGNVAFFAYSDVKDSTIEADGTVFDWYKPIFSVIDVNGNETIVDSFEETSYSSFGIINTVDNGALYGSVMGFGSLDFKLYSTDSGTVYDLSEDVENVLASEDGIYSRLSGIDVIYNNSFVGKYSHRATGEKSYALVDAESNTIISNFYSEMSTEDGEIFLINSDDGKYGYMNSDGEVLAMFDDAGSFIGEYAPVIRDGKAYLINRNMEIVSEGVEADSVSTLYADVFYYESGDDSYFMTYAEAKTSDTPTEDTGDTSDQQPAPDTDEGGDDSAQGDDIVSDIPTDDETGNDDVASDNTDEDANKDDTDSTGDTDDKDDKDKTSAETGAEGVAVAAAIALTAVGAAVLSRRKR